MLNSQIMEKYWKAKQKFLEKVKKQEDECVVLSDAKLDAKLGIYKSIDSSCRRLIEILESYQNCLFMLANEENALGKFLRDCSKQDKTHAGKIMATSGKAFNTVSHQRIKLYTPLLRLYHELETFHEQAVNDTELTVCKLNDSRTQYRSSLLWMKDISQNLDPDTYRQLEKFRHVQNQVRTNKRSFDCVQMDSIQKIDLLMASRCNLLNQILAPYQRCLSQIFKVNQQAFAQAHDAIESEDVYDYEFKTLKHLNVLAPSPPETPSKTQNENNESGIANLLGDLGFNEPSENKTSSEAPETSTQNSEADKSMSDLLKMLEDLDPVENRPSNSEDDLLMKDC